jgi:transcriptional regulator with XRE-family HTH domain
MKKKGVGQIKYLRLYRKKAHLTQKAIAKRIGVTEITIRRWESERREPRAPQIQKLCEVHRRHADGKTQPV